MTKEELIRNLKHTIKKHKNDRLFTFDTDISAMCRDVLEYIEQTPKIGYWTERKIHEPTGFFLPTCSECGNIQPYTHYTFKWNYCPSCGAKMESEDEE